jgi:hypothetical protein
MRYMKNQLMRPSRFSGICLREKVSDKYVTKNITK